MVNFIKEYIQTAVTYTVDLIYGFTGVEIAAGKILLVLMGLGISSLLLVMALFLLLLRTLTGSSQKKKARQEEKQEPQLEATATETKAPKAKGGLLSFIKKKDTPAQPSADTGGFVFLKKKSRKARGAADQIEPLSAIETEMLALKELYSTGHITADVYVAESRALYEKARKYA